MLDMYQRYTPKPINTYGGEERCASLKAQINAAILLFCKRLGVQKAIGGHFEHAVEHDDVTSINMSCLFAIIKTLSLSCN